MAVRVEQNAEPLPGYRLIERLGGGGFGEVWKAEAPGGFHKAIKFVFGDLSSSGDSDQRAKQELKALDRVRTVRHPYILSLERYEVIDGQLLIVMELADKSLWDRYKECRAKGLPGIPREELLRYMEETAEALDLMNHEYQLQHLDIKPQNLFLVHNHVKVADFGLVKDLEGSQASVTGGITPVYAAPETFDGRVTRFSDQYSLGIVYQELLTGQRPFAGTNVRQLILQHISGQPNVSPLPPGDQAHIARSLAKEPEERWPGCKDLMQALRASTVVPSSSHNGTQLNPLVDGTVRGSHSGTDLQPSPGSHQGLQPNTQLGSQPASQPGSQLGTGSTPPSWQGVQPSSGPLTSNIRLPQSETGSSQGTTQSLRAIDKAVLASPSNAGVANKPHQEINGPGSLFPALVVGLGQLGMQLMHRVRHNLHNHAAPLGLLPNLRFLLIDTDPEIVRTATRGGPGVALAPGDVILAPLNRPAYYLRPREGRPKIESWLNPRLLYRIPRSQVTTGVRALGRLAFCDNYRTIVRRFQLELEAATDTTTLNNAAKSTRLGLRTNRPRVYVLAGLGGGTGSGMFLDVAYNLRALLLQAGYENPDIIGVLLLPPVDGSRTRIMTLGNTYAALTELNWCAKPDTVFQGQYHDREAPIQDAGPPFSRTIMLPLPEETDEVATQELMELASQYLYRDMATPLGKAADLGRAGLTAPPWESRGQYFQTFNLFQLTWPRQALLKVVSRQLCQKIVNRWASKDSKPLREAVQEWVHQQWHLQELGTDSFIHRLQTEVIKALGRTTDSLFMSIVEPILPKSAQGVGAETGRSKTPPIRSLDPEMLGEILRQFETLLGTPADDYSPDSPPEMVRVLRTSAEKLIGEWSQKLAEFSVQLIEEPRFRLAGAEEAVRQLIATIEQSLQHHEPLARQLGEDATSAYERLVALSNLAKPGGRKPIMTAGEALELLRVYPKWRFQNLLLQQLTAGFLSLRGHLSDELREVGFCRVRLSELLRLLEEKPADEPSLTQPKRSSKEGSIGKRLFVSGCKDLSSAVQEYLEGMTADHLLELDSRMEEMLKGSFTALVHVCLTNANILKNVQQAMLAVARDFAAEHLPSTSVAELFFESCGEESAGDELATFYDEAAPEICFSRSSRGGPPMVDLCVLATPEDAASVKLRAAFKETMPEVDPTEARSDDDILIYRERNNLALNELEHLGPQGHDAYMQMSSTDNFTPHSRCDIDFRK